MHRHLFLILLLATTLSGCGLKDSLISDGSDAKDIALIDDQDAVPRDEPRSKTGNNPYEVFGKSYFPLRTANGYKERGIASWYGKKFHGRRTSSGETYNMYSMTAAHKTLPLPTYVRVTNLDNKKMVVLKVNDRGPFVDDRIIDLSFAAAVKLDIFQNGTGPVEVVALSTNTDDIVESKDPKFFLQVGSYRLKGNSKLMKDALENAGFKEVNVNKVVVDGANHYQVIIGPLKSNKTVTSNRERLARLFDVEPLTITE